MKYALVIAFVLSAGVIASVSGIKCYQCDYIKVAELVTGTENCKSGSLTDDLNTECADGFDACVKTSGSADSSEIVSRGCAPKAGIKMECNDGEQNGVKVSVCFCDSDGCNSSTNLKVTSALFLAIPALLAKYYL